MGRPEKPTRLRNDTNDPLYSLFRSTILYLVASGYSIETRVDVNPAWDREDKTSTKFITASRFCFDESLADRVFFQRARPDVDWHCGTKWSRERREKFVPIRKTISLYKPGGGTKEVCDVRFNTRSIYGTFNFLGRQLKDRDETIVRAEEDKDIDWSVLKDSR